MSSPRNNHIQKAYRAWRGAMLVTGFFVTLAAFLFWLDIFRTAESEVNILVISKTAQTSQAVAADLVGVTRTLSFYERLLEENEDLVDAWAGESQKTRKAGWQKKVEATLAPAGSVIILNAKDPSPETARLFVRESAQTLFTLAAFYYDIEREADLRLIDGPIMGTAVRQPALYTLVSTATGLGITALFFAALIFASKLLPLVRHPKPEADRSIESVKPVKPVSNRPNWSFIDPKKFIPARPASLSYEWPGSEAAARPVSFQKAVAPENLPVIGEEFAIPAASEKVPENLPWAEPVAVPMPQEGTERIAPAVGPAVPDTAEPTADEYKRRLNALLSDKQ